VRAELTEVVLGGSPEPWERLGLAGTRDVRFTFAPAQPPGIVSLGLTGLRRRDVDGVPVHDAPRGGTEGARAGLDHVVVLTDDLERTTARLKAARVDHRRTDPEPPRAFFVLGPALLELVEHGDRVTPWGLTLVVGDLGAYTEHTGPAKDAVQPGRRIATVRAETGLGLPVALMTPRRLPST